MSLVQYSIVNDETTLLSAIDGLLLYFLQAESPSTRIEIMVVHWLGGYVLWLLNYYTQVYTTARTRAVKDEFVSTAYFTYYLSQKKKHH